MLDNGEGLDMEKSAGSKFSSGGGSASDGGNQKRNRVCHGGVRQKAKLQSSTFNTENSMERSLIVELRRSS